MKYVAAIKQKLGCCARRTLAFSVCALTVASAQAAPLLTDPQEVSVGAYPARSIFILGLRFLDAGGSFSVHWSFRILTAGEVKISIRSSPSTGLQVTAGGVYSTNENYELLALVAPIKSESFGDFISDWAYVSPGYYLFSITGLTPSPDYIFNGVGILRAQTSTSDVPVPATLALLGLGLAGIASQRSRRSFGKGVAQ